MSHPGDRGAKRHTLSWAELKIGYARVSTDGQDLTAQRDALHALSVPASRVYVDHGLTEHQPRRPQCGSRRRERG